MRSEHPVHTSFKKLTEINIHMCILLWLYFFKHAYFCFTFLYSEKRSKWIFLSWWGSSAAFALISLCCIQSFACFLPHTHRIFTFSPFTCYYLDSVLLNYFFPEPKKVFDWVCVCLSKRNFVKDRIRTSRHHCQLVHAQLSCTSREAINICMCVCFMLEQFTFFGRLIKSQL